MSCSQSAMKRCRNSSRLRLAVIAFAWACMPTAFTGQIRHTLRSRSPHRTTTRAMATDDVAACIYDLGFGELVKSQPLGSSDWSSFKKITTSSGKDLFVKTSTKSVAQMFKPEALGLKALRDATVHDGVMKIPEVYAAANMKQGLGSYIVMEYLRLGGRGDDRALGRAMGLMHAHQPQNAKGFGFDVDNTIGATTQLNAWSSDWVEFFRDRRLQFQVKRAGDGYVSSLFKFIAPRMGKLFDGIQVKPSVLHGDLWSGNIGSADGLPCIFDPATYYGHHEAEWGMSWAASLSSSFWKGYREVIPKDPGFDDRASLYEAYHQLNHYNLFGGGYLNAAVSCLEAVKSSLDEKE